MSDMILQSLATANNYIHTGQIQKAGQLLSLLGTMPQAKELLQEETDVLFGKQWFGEPLEHKSIQVICDQGMGDIVQLWRYLKQIKENWDCKIVLNCYAHYEPFKQLVTQLGFISEFTNKHVKCDYWTNIMCVPFILNQLSFTYPPYYSHLLEKQIPEAPVLTPTKTLYLLGEKKIGIAWRSNPTNPIGAKKSLPLHLFEVLKVKGTCYSLLPSEGNLPGWLNQPKIENLQDTVNVIAALDEVYTVDTCVLHLAGSMKKKTTALLCKDHDPRWNRNVWYRNMELRTFTEKDIKEDSNAQWMSLREDFFL